MPGAQLEVASLGPGAIQELTYPGVFVLRRPSVVFLQFAVPRSSQESVGFL